MPKLSKKEIEQLVMETLKELGSVDHRTLFTAPIHSGMPEKPVSFNNDYYTKHINKTFRHLNKALEQITLVADELQSHGHNAGNLGLVKDQIANTIESLKQALEIGL